LTAILNSSKSAELGLPSVSYFANVLHLSPKYFGDLIKKETGNSAQDFIHLKWIELAKEKCLILQNQLVKYPINLDLSIHHILQDFSNKGLGKRPWNIGH
jgi:AraC-like DNA-binding protein